MNTFASVAGTVAVLTLFSVSDPVPPPAAAGLNTSRSASAAAASAAIGTSAAATAVSGGRLAAGADPAALGLLDRAIEAPEVTPYQGVQFISSWSGAQTASLVADIDHTPGRGTMVRLRGASQAAGGAVFTAAAAPRAAARYAAASSTVSLLARNYLVAASGQDTVAGRPADLLEARRLDGGLAGRFWLDDASGLMLRREIYDSTGATVLASAFISITVGSASQRSLPMAAADTGRRSGAELTDAQLAAICATGWSCPHSLAGQLDLYDMRRLDDPSGPVLHLSYSDGLSTVSIFEQHGRLGPGALTGYAQTRCGGLPVYAHNGMERTLMWVANGSVFTVVTDAPQETLDRLVPQLPHERPDPSPMARIDRGLHRVVSWLDPFD